MRWCLEWWLWLKEAATSARSMLESLARMSRRFNCRPTSDRFLRSLFMQYDLSSELSMHHHALMTFSSFIAAMTKPFPLWRALSALPLRAQRGSRRLRVPALFCLNECSSRRSQATTKDTRTYVRTTLQPLGSASLPALQLPLTTDDQRTHGPNSPSSSRTIDTRLQTVSQLVHCQLETRKGNRIWRMRNFPAGGGWKRSSNVAFAR